MEDVYMKELASFAAFQNHLKNELGIDAAALRWSALSITKESGVNAMGISSPKRRHAVPLCWGFGV